VEEKDKFQDSSYKESDSGNKDFSKSNINAIFDIINTTFAPLKALIKIHYKLAAREIKRDSERFFSGITFLFLGLFFLLLVWGLLNILAVVAFYDFLNFKLFYSILIVTGINLFFAIILFLSGISKVKKPMMSETRKLVKETFDELNNNKE